ncbi:GDSL-type esterase/lipase family protein [Nocardia neocaledoniensis]|uniref:GDSL-type esterase/lipase family protein n=1 Tax=Nocardia neocaledoniensis TaxID=236511 RepID=UPI00245759C6|nr:GDSL-type esterase/lipase family protein [Nocardia neocaledoniensis]
MSGDLRLCFLGDSFVQGIGDPEYRGWVGRVLAATGPDVTAFNLGIRRNTSADVLRRSERELDERMVAGADHRVVVSFGSNDAVEEHGRVRVEHAQCLENLATLLAQCRRRSIRALVVGPPPVIDAGAAHLARVTKIGDEMAALCLRENVPFIATTHALATDPVWCAEVTAGDGAHPGAHGYQRLAEVVLAGGWLEWIDG